MGGPINGLPLTLSLSMGSGATALRPGQTFQTLVQGQAPQLWLSAGGAKVPLGNPAGLTPGQTVTVTVEAQDGRVQLRVQPQPAALAAKPTSELPGLLANVLGSLGAPGMADDAAGLIPPDMPRTPAALRTLLTLFTARGESGKGLQWLAATVARAAQAGALPNGLASDFVRLVAQALASEERDIPKALREAGRQAGRSVEARLAAALRNGGLEQLAETLRSDLRGTLARLVEDKGFAEFLRGKGQFQEFNQTAGEILDRLAGRDIHNLHGSREPYVFFELPFAPDAPVSHAQIHLWSHSGGRGGIDPDRAQAAIDLSTTRLGDLWIALSVTKGHCACTIRATDPDAAAALDSATGELVEALCTAGYAGACVRVGLWDGNRLREAAALVRHMAGVDVKT